MKEIYNKLLYNNMLIQRKVQKKIKVLYNNILIQRRSRVVKSIN